MSMIQPREYPSTVLAKDSKDNAEATATAAAGSANQRYFITGVDASFTTLDTGKLLQLKDGTTVIWEGYVHTTLYLSFPSPIIGSYGTAFSAVLAASGSGGNLGKVNIRGYLL